MVLEEPELDLDTQSRHSGMLIQVVKEDSLGEVALERP